MAWVSAAAIPSRIFRGVSEEIDLGSPRATAIVGAAFVEDHLQRLIQARLVDDEKVVDQTFGPNSALGSFSAKINLGYLFGLYSKEAYRELNCIRTIRNDFAHELHINDFDIDTIKDRCANLRVWEQTKVSISKVEDKKDTLAFVESIRQVGWFLVCVTEPPRLKVIRGFSEKLSEVAAWIFKCPPFEISFRPTEPDNLHTSTDAFPYLGRRRREYRAPSAAASIRA